jgi:hypothetical protein
VSALLQPLERGPSPWLLCSAFLEFHGWLEGTDPGPGAREEWGRAGRESWVSGHTLSLQATWYSHSARHCWPAWGLRVTRTMGTSKYSCPKAISEAEGVETEDLGHPSCRPAAGKKRPFRLLQGWVLKWE